MTADRSAPPPGAARLTARVTACVLAAWLAAVALPAAPAARGTPPPAPDAAGAQPHTAAPAGLRGAALARRVDRMVEKMPLPQRVGQLFTTYVYGSDANTPDPRNTELYGVATPAEVVEKYHLGGVIYFAWSDNLGGGPRQIARLSNGLQRAALGSGPHLPLMISTDQEHGVVTRVGPPATQFPGSMALGAARSRESARRAAAISGRELRALGINQNFAPVADVNVNPANPVIGVRSFSSDPALAASLTSAQVRGHQQRGGVASTVKHFPGHGDTATDSHTGIPYITHTRREWERVDAPPFRAAVAAGTDAIMTGHLVMPALDPTETPATLSEPILSGLLREELGYDGVVVTDALTMDGVRATYGDDRIPVMALNAGADVLLMPKDMDVAYRAVLDAVRTGEIPGQRIEEAVARVLKLKITRGVVARPLVNAEQAAERVGTDRSLACARAVSDRTTTLVKNDTGLLPFSEAPDSMLVAGAGSAETDALVAAVADRGTDTTRVVTGTRPTDTDIADVVAQAGRHAVTVVLTQRATHRGVDPDRQQAKLVQALLDTGRPVVVAAVRDPYDVAAFDSAPVYLATYSTEAVSMASLAKVVYGERAPTGRLPVAIPTLGAPDTDLYPFGHGLTW